MNIVLILQRKEESKCIYICGCLSILLGSCGFYVFVSINRSWILCYSVVADTTKMLSCFFYSCTISVSAINDFQFVIVSAEVISIVQFPETTSLKLSEKNSSTILNSREESSKLSGTPTLKAELANKRSFVIYHGLCT